MGFLKFVFSKHFVIQLLLAIVGIVLFCFLGLKWMAYYTNHSQRIEVPNVKRLSVVLAKKSLENSDLRAAVQDSANFDPKFPPLSIIDQNPKAGNLVKENRKIYLTVNPSGYRKIQIPDVIQKTLRQTKPTLQAIGFNIGEKIYVPNLAKDVVLELRHEGKKLQPGDMLMKTSTIDLVLGDGSQ